MTFLEILILIIVGAFAIRFSFKFDMNQFLESRRKIKMEQLKNICPHGHMDMEGNKISFQSSFESPAGTTRYICNQCGLIVNSDHQINRMNENILKNPESFIERKKKFVKKAKKLKLC